MDGNEADVFALSGAGVARGNSREWPKEDKADGGIAGIALFGGAVVGVEGMVQYSSRCRRGCSRGGSGSAVGDTVDDGSCGVWSLVLMLAPVRMVDCGRAGLEIAVRDKVGGGRPSQSLQDTLSEFNRAARE